MVVFSPFTDQKKKKLANMMKGVRFNNERMVNASTISEDMVFQILIRLQMFLRFMGFG